MFTRLYHYLLLLTLFLLPWQTRWIYAPRELNGGYWEYGTMSLYGVEVLLWLFVLGWGILQIKNRKNIQPEQVKKFPGYYFWSALIIFAWSFLAIAKSLDPELAWYKFSHWVLAVCLIFILYSYKAKKKELLWAVWCGGVIQGILAVAQFFAQSVWGNKWLGMASQSASQLGSAVIEFKGERWLRAYGSFGWPNSLGIFLAGVFIIGLILYKNIETGKARIILGIGQLFIASGIILSFSRNAILATIIGTIIFLIINIWKREPVKKFLPLAVYGAIIAITLAVIYLPFFNLRLQASDRLETASLQDRQTQLQEWKAVYSENQLWGVGPGNYTLALYKINSDKPVWDYQPVHRIYNLILAEWGAPLAVVIFVLLAGWVYRLTKNKSDFLALAIVLIFTGIYDHSSASMFSGIVWWGVVVGLSFYSDSDNKH